MVTTDDLVRDGVLRIESGGVTVEHRYDPLTGAELSSARSAGAGQRTPSHL
jgi:hypothetical protein